MEQKKLQDRHLLDFSIAGFTYWDGCMVLEELRPGMKLDLVREQ